MSNGVFFICIDDDRTHNMLCEYMLRGVLPDVKIQAFDQPEDALSFFKSEEFYNLLSPGIIFLDINMPGISGWEFLEKMEKLGKNLDKTSIYMLSSSIDEHDKQRAKDNPLVSGYIEKPLSLEIIEKLVKKFDQQLAP